MKTVYRTMLAVAAVAMLTVGCGGKKSDAPLTIGIAQTTDEAPLDAQETALDAQVNGNTLTYGQHSYTVNGDIDFSSADHKTPTASVVFSNFPATYEEFAAVYNGLLGKSMQERAVDVSQADGSDNHNVDIKQNNWLARAFVGVRL